MRYFIGLDIEPKDKLALEAWREKSLPELPRVKLPRDSKAPVRQPKPVPAANFHITLCFLGNITARQLEAISAALENLNGESFQLTLDSTGVWSGPKIFFVAPSDTPDALKELAANATSIARQADISVEKRDYQPHVTLIRNVRAEFPPPLFQPEITCRFKQFHLLESVSTNSGVCYPIRQSWPLGIGNSVREKLLKGQF